MKQVLFFVMVCLISTGLFAQDDKQPKDGSKIEALKIAYLTQRLNLTTEEAQKFWPVYNKYVAEIRTARQQNRNTDEIDLEEKIVAIRKRYKNDFNNALPGNDRVNKFFKADKEFNTLLQKEMIERRQQRLDRKQRMGVN
jgi:hypothetical protein